MKTTRLARRLGLDGNPLRRRTDRIGTAVAAGLLAAFLVAAPLLALAAASWAGQTGAAERRAERAWHQVSAILLRNAPTPPAFASGLDGGSWVPARWRGPDGRARTGQIPASAGLAAGQIVRVWVDAAGSPTGPPLSYRAVADRAAAAAVAVPVLLGIVLWCVAGAARWMLDRRRLTAWGTAWAAVGPQWTKRFRSRG